MSGFVLVLVGAAWLNPAPLVAWQVEAPAAPVVQQPPPPPPPEAAIVPPPIVERLEGANPPAPTKAKLRQLEAELRRQIAEYTQAARQLKPFLRPGKCMGCPDGCHDCACGCGRSGPVTPPEPPKVVPLPIVPGKRTPPMPELSWIPCSTRPGWDAYGRLDAQGYLVDIQQWRPTRSILTLPRPVQPVPLLRLPFGTAPFRVFGGGGCARGVCR